MMTHWLTIKSFTVRSLLVLGSIVLLASGLQLFYIQHVLRDAEFLLSPPPTKLYIGLCLIDSLLLLALWAGVWKLYHIADCSMCLAAGRDTVSRWPPLRCLVSAAR